MKYRQNKNNIMEKEIKITPPEGFEIDKEHSTFECIKFKPVTKRWRDRNNNMISGYYLKGGNVYSLNGYLKNWTGNHDVFATAKQAKSVFAMAQISQIMANDERFGGVVTDEEWKDRTRKFVLTRIRNEIYKDSFEKAYKFLAFHTREQRDLFLEENEDLIRDYLMID